MLDGFRVFDVHLHVQPWARIKPEVMSLLRASLRDPARVERAQSDPRELQRFLDEEGVDRAVLVNYVAPDVTGTDESVNPWVARFAAAAPERLVPMGGVHPARVEDGATAVDDALRDGVKAFKLHPSHSLVDPLAYLEETRVGRNLAAIYRRLEERRVPLTVHTGTSVFPGARNRLADPLRLDDVAVDFPRLKLVLAHAGRPFWYEQAQFLARRHPNVHLDLSGIPPQKLLDVLPRLPDLADKAMFGSDWPGPGVRSVAANARAFLALPLPAKAKEQVLWENACGVFGAP